MKTYLGFARNRDWQVVIEDLPYLSGTEGDVEGFIIRPFVGFLRNRRDLRDHSPDGFAWGYGGSGPAQLALSLLADALGDDERALRLHQPFKWKYITTIPQSADWAMSVEIVRILADIVEKEHERNYERLGRPEDRQDMKSGPTQSTAVGPGGLGIPMRNMRDFDKL